MTSPDEREREVEWLSHVEGSNKFRLLDDLLSGKYWLAARRPYDSSLLNWIGEVHACDKSF